MASRRALNVCIIGGGPAGFYTAHQLLKRNPSVRVTIVESRPVPFGLVRYGVAPDHPEVKNVESTFDGVLRNDRVTYAGNVNVASVRPFVERFSAVVLAYGASADRKLNVPGEDAANVIGARDFVGFYNGQPEQRELSFDLTNTDTACIVGMGNVAVDCARMLLTHVDVLRTTDMPTHALERLSESRIRRVVMVARRGPLEVAFTIKELREMTKLPNVFGLIRASDMAFGTAESAFAKSVRRRARLMDLMRTQSERARLATDTKEWEMLFMRSPTEIEKSESGVISGVRLGVNQWKEDEEIASRSVYCDESATPESLECGLLLRSIGYRSVAMDGVPFDSARGLIPTQHQRVMSSFGADGVRHRGLYTAGWVGSGPTGVLLNTMDSAFTTAEAIISDFEAGEISEVDESDATVPVGEGQLIVDSQGWRRIDAHERSRGKGLGKPREKVVTTEEFLQVAHKDK